MIHFSRQKKVRYSALEMYDLVNDTESYKDFIPFCQESRVLSSSSHEKLCQLAFVKGPISRVLETRNILYPAKRIEVFLHKGDFKHLQGRWDFESIEEGCEVKVAFEYAFSDPMVEYVLGSVVNQFAEQFIEIFEKRADVILR